jgi:hypothetical protein
VSRLRRLPPRSLRAAPAWLTPQLVGRVLAVADALGAEPQPAPAPSPRKPVKMPRVVPTIGAIDVIPVRVDERPDPLAEATEEKLVLGVRPDSPSSPEGSSDNAGAPIACELPQSASPPQPRRAREPAPVRVATAPVTGAARIYRRAALEAAPAPRPAPSKAPVTIVTLPTTPRAPRKPVPVGWVEQRMARAEAATAFLRGKGFGLSRVLHFQNNEPTGRFHVSGYHGEFDRTQLLELALSLGFEQ